MRTFAIAVALGGITTGVLAEGENFPLDVDNGAFRLYTTNSNDGYNSARGVVFTVDESFVVNGASLWTQASSPLNTTFELYSIETTTGDVLSTAVLERSFRASLEGDLGFHGGKWDEIELRRGQSYLVRVLYEEAADENWFFDFDPVFFGDPPVDLGPVTVIDGTLGGNTSNFVMPLMGLQIPGDDCAADLDGDNDTDADDFFAYLDAFANGDLSICDIDEDDDCDADDFFGYLDLFAQGC